MNEFTGSLQRDEVLALARLGQSFKAQQVGRRPGALAHLVRATARRVGPPYSFSAVLGELELEAARGQLHAATPVERVDRVWQLLTLNLPRRGRVQIPFATLRNHLTVAKRILQAEIPGIP